MTFHKRDLQKTLNRFKKFPVIAILGPRQSGKTTLAKHTFKNHIFLNLEDLELRALALSNPKGFLRTYENKHGIILDEFQNCPDILSYIQVLADEKNRPGYFVLTGSQNFLVNEAISQSLAGRVGILTLLPFSINELSHNNLLDTGHPEESIYKGQYPKLYNNSFEPHEVYPSYIHTYVERDVRQLVNVVNLSTFQKFMKLCAARVGQLLNYTDLAVNCGISVPTVKQWLSILEASYILFLLRPHWTNFNKRVTSSPKLYFYDTGLACSLLEIESAKRLIINPYYGHLFENFIISDLLKQYYNLGLRPPVYFWRDKNGALEVDCLIEHSMGLIPIEIKSGETFDRHYFDSLIKWSALAKQSLSHSYLIYGGTQTIKGAQGNLIAWDQCGTLVEKLRKRTAKTK